jgi:integrase
MTSRIQLTKKAIECIELNGNKQQEVTDLTEPALRIIKYADTATFIARVFWKTKRYYRTLGSYPYISIPKARQMATQFKGDIQTGEFNYKSLIRLRDFVYQVYKPYILYVVKNKTALECIKRLETHFFPSLGDKPLGQINQFDIISLLNTRAEIVENSTVNRDKSLISSVFRLAIEKGIIDEYKSPVKNIKKLKENNTHKKKLPSKEQIQQIIKFCHSEPDHTLGCDLILLLIYTGLRLSEALSLRVGDIKNEVTSIWLEENKADRPVGLPANSEAQVIIKRLIATTNNDYLFPSPVLTNHSMGPPRRLLTKLKSHLKLSEFGFHYCRAIFCTAVAKTNIHMAQKLLNHSDIKTTNLYIYHDDSSLMQASESVVSYYNN